MCHKTGHSYSMDKLLILFWFEKLISLEYNDHTLTRQVSSPSPEVELKQEVIQCAIQNVNGAVDEEEKGAFLNDILLLHILYCRDTIKFHRCLQRKTDVMTYWKPRDSERLKFAIKLYRVYLLIRICHEVLNELNSFWLHLLFSGWVDNKHSKSRPGETLG